MTELLRKRIEDTRAEEIADIDKYEDLIELAEEQGHPHVAGILHDILCDEKSHSIALHHILDMTKGEKK